LCHAERATERPPPDGEVETRQVVVQGSTTTGQPPERIGDENASDHNHAE
jgi:hypothetical protein